MAGGAAPGSESADGQLLVAYAGIARLVAPTEQLSFGRGSSNSLQIGEDDVHVHRRAGSFRWVAGRWDLSNDGSTTTLEVEVAGGLEAHISVGSHPLTLPFSAHGTVRLMTPSPYSIEFTTPASVDGSASAVEKNVEGDDATMDPRTGLGLSDQEVRLLVALCEPRLRDPRLPAFTIPSTKDLCARLEITPKKVEDIVDSLVVKLARHVDGVIGSNDGRAVNRRHKIAAFAIDVRCVTRQDLRLLDTP